MNIKFKTIAATAILAAVSATASATISTGNATNPTSDLLFVAWANDATGDSYIRDLGPLTSTALASSTTFAAPTASIFASTFAGVDPTTIQWNVVSFNTQQIQVYTTGDITQPGNVTHAQVLQAGGNEEAQLGGLTQLDVAANGYAFANGEYTGSKDLNAQTNASEIAYKAAFGQPVDGQGVGASQNFLEFDTSGKVSQLYLNAAGSAFDNNDAGGYFTLADAQGDLTWTNPASVSSVPLPGAALLFLPGLLGMMGIGRRNKKIAA